MPTLPRTLISHVLAKTDSRSRPDSGGSSMEGTTMVCSATVNVGGLATPAASTVSPHLGINPHTTQTDHMEHLRKRLPSYRTYPSVMEDKNEQVIIMTPFLGDGVAGVANGVQIHFQDL